MALQTNIDHRATLVENQSVATVNSIRPLLSGRFLVKVEPLSERRQSLDRLY
jgi:hypothetical protein